MKKLKHILWSPWTRGAELDEIVDFIYHLEKHFFGKDVSKKLIKERYK
jgi:hypothetical protein